ncbi:MULTISPECIES: helix-turn-helix domain-containing protein [unclassified Clostridium]|uniref:helix-turn-helix domain-containing protein n=1 Tax=unclassified Clostridium TaxID=2614128 RepID=UPI0032173CA4
MDFLSPGKRLKALRQQLNIKQVELEEIGVSRNYISMVESDKRNLTGVTLANYLKFMQNKADELETNINLDVNYLLLPEKEEARNYCHMKLDLTLSHKNLDEVIKIGEKYKLEDILLKSYLLKGNLLYDENSYNTAFVYYYKILEIHNDNKDNSNKSFAYIKLSKCKIMTLSYEEALTYLFKAYSYCKEFNDDTNLRNCLYNIALVYKKLGEYDNALIYIDELLNICDCDTNINVYIISIILKCNCYLKKKDYHLALTIYFDILNNFSENIGVHLGLIYNNIGCIYCEINEIDKSIDYFNRSISFRKVHDIKNLNSSIIDMSSAYVKENSYDKAIELLYEGIALSEKYSNIEFLIRGYSILEDIYIKLNDKNKLEEIYLVLVEILKEIDVVKVLGIYIKLSLLYMDIGKYDKSKEILYEANNVQKLL